VRAGQRVDRRDEGGHMSLGSARRQRLLYLQGERPVEFFADPQGVRFHEAYFSQHHGIWTHGDSVELSERNGARILGRSDGVLNIRGIRIGPGEIYRVLEDFVEIKDALAIEQVAPEEPGGSRFVLLVVLASATLDRPLTLKIKKALATRASQAHVPALIAAVDSLPRTHNNKVSASAARDAANGLAPSNLSAIKDPASLDAIRNHPEIASVRRKESLHC